MKLFSWLSFLFLAIVMIACGSVGGNATVPGNTGSLSLTVQVPAAKGKHHNSGGITSDIVIPGGEILSSVSYKLTNGTNTYNGTGSIASTTTSATFVDRKSTRLN